MPRTVRTYRWLAEYYDEVFAGSRGPIDAARERVLGRILPRVETACDLACGTGETALDLARRGIRTVAVDVSAGMCRMTREKVRRAGLPVRVIRADMRNFRLPEPVDLVGCECDALNHVPREADLRVVARCVARALRPGGHFYFDVNNARGFERYWCGNLWLEKPGIVLVMRNGHDGSRAWSDIEWFLRRGNGWQRRRERVEEVCWEREEIRGVFEKAGFNGLRAWDGAPFFKESSQVTRGCRTVYLARKRRA